MAPVDVVVVSFNSRETLRDCVEPLCGEAGITVIVVDNASSDGSVDSITDLPALVVGRNVNGGFASGCNAGWRAGEAPYVLLLNPDARIQPDGIRALARALDEDPAVGIVAPRIVTSTGSLDFSQRRHARLRSTFARALFLHRLSPRSAWADELVRDEERYRTPGTAEWVSGACLLVRRAILEQLGGLDERFFMYCEDADLCRRTWNAGYSVRFEPAVTCVHEGGASAPRGRLLPVLAASRIDYARTHGTRVGSLLERAGIALGAVTHLLAPKGREVRVGHARTLRVVVAREPRAAALAASGVQDVPVPEADVPTAPMDASVSS